MSATIGTTNPASSSRSEIEVLDWVIPIVAMQNELWYSFDRSVTYGFLTRAVDTLILCKLLEKILSCLATPEVHYYKGKISKGKLNVSYSDR